MSAPVEFFTLRLLPGEIYHLDTIRDLQITNVSYSEPENLKGKKRSVLRVHYAGNPIDLEDDEDIEIEDDDEDEREDEDEDEEDEEDDERKAAPATKRRSSRATPRAKRARTDEPAEEPEAAATTAAVREQDEELDPATRKVREWRHKLQRAFLSKAGVIVAEDMDAQDATFKTVEAYQDMTVDQLKATKIGKVMKRIYQLPDIPRDDEFHFRERAGELMKRWSALIGSHAPSEDNDA